MSAARAEAVLRTIAACLNTVITWISQPLRANFPWTAPGSAGQLPPVVSAPNSRFVNAASSVFTLEQYVEQGIMTPEQKEVLCEAIGEHKNILVIGGGPVRARRPNQTALSMR